MGGHLKTHSPTASGAAVGRFLGRLTMTGGDCDGEAFAVLPWEKRLLRVAFDSPGDVAVSVARGNGKSALVAAIATAVVDPDGPLHGPRREVIAVASSFQQGRVIFEDVLAFLRARHGKLASGTWRLQDSANNAAIEHRESGARVRCIGSDPARAHGLRPFLVLADEPAQWERSTRDRMHAALSTSLGKVPGSKLIALGTRPASAEHWFSTMLADPDRSVVYAARPGDSPFTLRAIRRANPSYSHLPSLRAALEREAASAKRDSGQLASWLALRLNMGTPDTVESMVMDAETWRRAEGEALPIGPYALGVDLGGASAMSACAAYWPQSGRLDCFAAFPRIPGLAERGLADQVGPEAYQRMADRGELVVAGDRVPDIGRLLAVAVERWGAPSAVATDRYRADELLQVLEASGLPVCPLSERGMGFKDGAEDLRAFVHGVLAGRVTPKPSLLLRTAMAEARTVSDPAGNVKLSKGTQGGRRGVARDDAVAAAVLAVSEGLRQAAAAAAGPAYAVHAA